MFDKLKKFFQRSSPAPAAKPLTAPLPPRHAPAPAPTPAQAAPRPAAPSPAAAPAPRVSGQRPTPSAQPRTAVAENITLPIESIVPGLPDDIRSKFVKDLDPSLTVTLPGSRVIDQLASGAVRIPFGELRALLPPGTYTGAGAHDQLQVQLPLAKILARVNPALLPRRTLQKRVEIPGEVTGLFGTMGQPLAPPPGTQVQPVSEPPPAAPKPAPPPEPPAAAPAQIPIPAALREFAARSKAPVVTTPTPAPAPTAPVAPAPKPIPPPAPLKPAAPVPVASDPATAVAAPAAAGGVVTVPLDQLADGWPEPIRKEIDAWALPQAALEIPVNELAGGMKSGKISFTWKQVLMWVKPLPPGAGASPLSGTALELPLRIIAPLFMKSATLARPQRKVAIAESIPDLFGSDVMPKPAEPAPAPAAVPAPTPEALPTRPAEPAPRPVAAPQPGVAPAPIPVPAAAAAPAAPVLPTKLPRGPGEVVKFVASMAGMQGAVVALQDGLLIAAQLPPTLSGETIAAFLPQMFGRLSQYTVELNAGELSQLTFKAGNTSWAVFKSGEVYFAAVGAPEKPLPLAELTVLAAEAGRQN